MKSVSINKPLNALSYETMAMLLQISVGQWAMYVAGKRSLPLAAKQQLVAMLCFVKEKNSLAIIDQKFDGYKNEQYQLFLIDLQNENILKQNKLIKQLSTLCNEEQKATTAMHFIEFLQSKNKYKTTLSEDLYKTIKIDLQNSLQKNNLLKQMQLQMKIKILKAEEKQIFSALKKL